MRVVRVSVRGLFGIFDHDIPLQSEERVTIIHGPNGFGKTVVLRMIVSLIEGRPDIFVHTPFEEFSLTLDDGSSRVVRRFADNDPQTKAAQIRLHYAYRDRDGRETDAAPGPVPKVPKQ